MFLLALFLLLPGPAVAARFATSEPAVSALPAVAAEPNERTLEPGEIHWYDIEVDAPTLLVVEVKQRGVDLRLSLVDAEGVETLTVAGPGGPWSDEILAAVLETPDTYRLQVTTDAEEDRGGRYRLKTVELRPAGRQAPRRVDAERRFHDALQQRDLPAGGEAAKTRSIEQLRTVVTSLTDLGAKDRLADALHELGSTLLEVSRLEPALGAMQQERSLRRQLADAAGEAWALEGIARILVRRGEFDGALQALGDARRLAATVDDRDLNARLDNTLGLAYFQQQDYARAIAPFQRAVSGHRSSGDEREEAIALMNLGLALRTTGDEMLRCSAIEESARLLERLRYPSPNIFLYLGSCRQRQNRIRAAVRAYERALDQAKAEGDPERVSLALLYSGSLLAELGDFQLAESQIDEARRTVGDGGRTEFRASILSHLGWLALAQDDADTALKRFQQALDLLPQGEEAVFQRSVASAHRGLGDALLRLGRPHDALPHLTTARDLSLEAAERRPAEALRKLGIAYMAIGDLDAAEEVLEQAIQVARGDAAQEGATRSQLARLAARQGRLREALDEIDAAIAIRESVRQTVAPPSLRASYLARWRDDYGLAIDLRIRLAETDGGEPDPALVAQALTLSEKAHSRTLQELLVEARSKARTVVPPALAAEQQRQEERMSELGRRLTGGGLSAAETTEVRRELERTAAELVRIEWEIRDRFGQTEDSPPFDPAALQAELRPDEALLEYVLGEERSYVFVVTRDDITVQPLAAAAEITRLVSSVRSGLVAERRHLWRRMIDVSRELYDDLMTPVAGRLEAVERLIVVPDGKLFYLPFETLLRDVPPPPFTPADLAPHYLVSRWQVSYVPSATVLSQLQRTAWPAAASSAPDRKMLVAFADSRQGTGPGPAEGGIRSAPRHGSLPGAQEEVASIARLMPAEDVLLLRGEEATESRLTEGRQPTRWYHFAVHGILDQQHPELSGLVLADGELQVHEIYDLDLDAELVVLSACETGLGREVSGEELIGLSRAFFYAGVPTVVVSLWRVADTSAATLMVDFYRHLLAGQDPAVALAAAKRLTMTVEGEEHPYHWAPFIVIGYPRPATVRNSSAAAAPNLANDKPIP